MYGKGFYASDIHVDLGSDQNILTQTHGQEDIILLEISYEEANSLMGDTS